MDMLQVISRHWSSTLALIMHMFDAFGFKLFSFDLISVFSITAVTSFPFSVLWFWSQKVIYCVCAY